MNTEIPPGYEPASKEHVQQYGFQPESFTADDGQVYWKIGTLAMLSTPLPPRVCKGIECAKFGPGNDLYICHDEDCPAHPRNELVHVLPEWLAALPEKPEGLMWATPGEADWEPCDYEWPFCRENGCDYCYAYAIPHAPNCPAFTPPAPTQTPEKPWRVRLTTPIFEQHECDVVDIGYSDRVLIVNCAEIDARVAAALARAETAERERDELLSWKMFYGENKSLGQIAEHFKTSIYSFSPWLYAPLVKVEEDRDSLARELSDYKGSERILAQLLGQCAKAVGIKEGEAFDPPDIIHRITALRTAGEALAAMLDKYQRRYVGSEHARKDHEAGALALKDWRAIASPPEAPSSASPECRLLERP